MNYTKEQLQEEISNRAPWYQSIDFPQYGISTTDNADNAFSDNAWDNMLRDISIEEATRLRPKPKWNEIQNMLPNLHGMDILEIGCNCGFFSLTFAREGAKSVVGLDIAPEWLSNAQWCKDVLGYDNVEFKNCDFMNYDRDNEAVNEGLLCNENLTIPLPNNQFDIVFTSTVLDHLFFPLFAIYKMIRIARKWVVIDVPIIESGYKESSLMKLSFPEDLSHHGFNGSIMFFVGYFQRLGIPTSDIHYFEYNDGRSVTYLIDTSNAAPGLSGA